MTISERSPERKAAIRWPGPGGMMRLGLIALALVVLHVLAASLVLPANSHGPVAPLQDARASSTD